MERYSVLMSVYSKETPDNLSAAIRSMLEQTVPTDDFVIVCDGPLTDALNSVLEGFILQYPDVINIVRLDKNMGIGAAANAGLQVCKNDLVAKMDSDDISLPQRCEMQLRKFAEDPTLTVLGGYIEEFETDPAAPFSVRCVPKSNEEIRRFSRHRQPFNNVTVMYRRSAVLAVGGYRALRRYEDYDMYIRLLHADYPAANLSDVLVNVRVEKRATKRRASMDALVGCVRTKWNACRIGYISFSDFLYCCAAQLFISLCPTEVLQLVYKHFLRQDPAWAKQV